MELIRRSLSCSDDGTPLFHIDVVPKGYRIIIFSTIRVTRYIPRRLLRRIQRMKEIKPLALRYLALHNIKATKPLREPRRYGKDGTARILSSIAI